MPSLPHPTTNPSSRRKTTFRASLSFLEEWLQLAWFDLLCMLILGLITIVIYYAPVPSTRTFPVTFAASGDIVYPQWAYPYRGWIIPSWLAGAISIGGPIAIYLIAQLRIKSAWDASNAIIGTTWAVLLASLFQVVLKQTIGGFRPYFLEVCQPDLSLAGTHNHTGLNGVGFQRVMYTIDICTQPDKGKLKDAITSFPSGHATAAFAGFGFLFLWTNAKLKVWADHKPAFWKLTAAMLPILAPVAIASSLTIDAAHNWYDIAAGSAIGIVTACASYRTSYAALWDWRFNHIPLLQTVAFVFEDEDDTIYATQTISGSVGWGPTKDCFEQDRGGGEASGLFSRRRRRQLGGGSGVESDSREAFMNIFGGDSV